MNQVLVLMATYNGEKYLDQQLYSIYNQKGVMVEVLVRDDGSKDNTCSILNSWSKREKLKWYTGEHLSVKYGFYDLMLKAAETQYEYFAFCDQDDIWDADKLATALNNIDKYPKEKMCLYYCGQRLVDEELNILSIHDLKDNRSNFARFMFNDAAGCTQVFNRSLLNRIVQYRPTNMSMHDVWLVKVCLALGGELIVDKNPHMNYRQHTNNVVGLKNDLKSKVKRAANYIFDRDIESQMKDLKNGYIDQIIPEYISIVNDTLNYKYNIKSKFHLLNLKKFNFEDRGVSVAYLIKVLINKL